MHKATEQFWQRYWNLPKDVRDIADKNFQLFKENIRHPSIQFKKVGAFWSARVGLAHRALALDDDCDYIWVWIGTHDEYDKIIKRH